MNIKRLSEDIPPGVDEGSGRIILRDLRFTDLVGNFDYNPILSFIKKD